MFKDCFQVENFGMEVKDFEGAVKMQGAMMDKLAAARLLTHWFLVFDEKQQRQQHTK